MWRQAAATVLGLWLMASPAVLDYDEPASSVAWIVGPTAAAVGFIAAFKIGRPLRWLNVPLGGALVIAPWVLDYTLLALLNALVVGAALAAFAVLTPAGDHEYAGGWSSLFR